MVKLFIIYNIIHKESDTVSRTLLTQTKKWFMLAE